MTNLTAEQVIERAKVKGMRWLIRWKADGRYEFVRTEPVGFVSCHMKCPFSAKETMYLAVHAALASGARFEELGEMG